MPRRDRPRFSAEADAVPSKHARDVSAADAYEPPDSAPVLLFDPQQL